MGEKLLSQNERNIAKCNVNRYDKQINFLNFFLFLFPLSNFNIYMK